MKLLSFQQENFKNLLKFSIFLDSRRNSFWGENGAGKTNLLEAIYVTIKGKSFRPYALKQAWLPHIFNSPEDKTGKTLNIHLEFEDEKSFPLTATLCWSEGRWKHLFNGKKASAAKINAHIPLIAFSPDDHALIRQGPDLRRDFLYDLFSDVLPGYREVLQRFQKTLKSRNEILKKQKKMENFRPTKELESWTALFSKEARELSTIHQSAWKTLETYFLEISSELLRIPDLSIRYVSKIPPEINSEAAFHDYIMENFMADCALGWTSRGPQRDDFEILIGNASAKHSASQAQARILALSLKWIHTQWLYSVRSEKPIFLVDDFSSELDFDHRNKLLDRIESLSSQILITTTDNSFLKEKFKDDFYSFEIQKGSLAKNLANQSISLNA